MASLVGQQLKDTYDSLLKTSDNDALGGTYKEITDGSGNGSGLYLGTGGRVGIGASSPSKTLDVRGDGIFYAQSGNTSLDLTATSSNDTEINFGSFGASANVGKITGDSGALALVFESNTTERLRIKSGGDISFRDTSTNEAFYWDASAGSLGIGTTSPDANLHVSGSGTQEFRITSSNGNPVLRLDGPSGNLSYIQWNSAGSAPLTFYDVTTSSERMRIDSSGYLRLAGAGIQFNGDTASANALDDYEEGTWTPVYAPQTGSFTTMTMDVLSATYTKIGRQVTIRAYFRTDNVDATGASGQLRVGGLPFASAGSNGGTSAVSLALIQGWTNAPDSGFVEEGQSYILLRKTNSSVYSDVSDLTTGATINQNQLILTATYFV